MNGLTLDGVIQSPARADEDTRGGFEHGGWAIPYGDEAMEAKMGERMGEDREFVFGRRTYEDLLSTWNARGGPFKDAFNRTRKYVAASNRAANPIAPLVLGAGRRMFAGGLRATLRLVEASTTSKGVVLAVYERARD